MKGISRFVANIMITDRVKVARVRIFMNFSVFFMNKIIYQREELSQITSLIKGFSFNSICYIIFDGFEYAPESLKFGIFRSVYHHG